MPQFKAGDVVQLKSGGPQMTVSSLLANDRGYRCQWFDSKHELKTGNFMEGEVQAFKEDESNPNDDVRGSGGPTSWMG
jgi:uncharacterized protein YodC (DUF2158 family)